MTAKKDDDAPTTQKAAQQTPPAQPAVKPHGGVAAAPKGAPVKVRLTKRAVNAPGPLPMPKGAGTTGFDIQDNGDETFIILGTTGSGNAVDIASVASISVTSDHPEIVTVDLPDQQNLRTTFGVHAATNPAPKIGDQAKVTIVATWDDGSRTFTLELTYQIQAGPITGLVAVPVGTPTVH